MLQNYSMNMINNNNGGSNVETTHLCLIALCRLDRIYDIHMHAIQDHVRLRHTLALFPKVTSVALIIWNPCGTR